MDHGEPVVHVLRLPYGGTVSLGPRPRGRGPGAAVHEQGAPGEAGQPHRAAAGQGIVGAIAHSRRSSPTIADSNRRSSSALRTTASRRTRSAPSRPQRDPGRPRAWVRSRAVSTAARFTVANHPCAPACSPRTRPAVTPRCRCPTRRAGSRPTPGRGEQFGLDPPGAPVNGPAAYVNVIDGLGRGGRAGSRCGRRSPGPAGGRAWRTAPARRGSSRQGPARRPGGSPPVCAPPPRDPRP
ncbi:UNVERIFIED_CONTAM: hypothetical protein RKD50_007878 [Streptomyces canus]